MRITMSDSAFSPGDSSGLDGLLENYRRELEEELAQKLEAKNKEFRQGMAKLDEIAENTFVAVQKEEQERMKEEEAFEQRSRDYIRSLRQELNRKVMAPSQVQTMADFAMSWITGMPGKEREGGESS